MNTGYDPRLGNRPAECCSDGYYRRSGCYGYGFGYGFGRGFGSYHLGFRQACSPGGLGTCQPTWNCARSYYSRFNDCPPGGQCNPVGPCATPYH